MPDEKAGEIALAKIAIDVVLLPSQGMMDRAIEANRQLLRGSGDEIVLNKEDCLPHISLAMGCIDQADIDDIGSILQEITGKCAVDRLKVAGIHVGTNSAGKKVSAFQIETAEALQSLHEEVMQKVGPYLSYDVTADMLIGSEVSESTLLWIRNYPQKSSFRDFFPHITIGYGEITDFPSPVQFCPSRLALCHLGDHCTCRKVLASWAL